MSSTLEMLRDVLELRELLVYFQPIFNIRTGNVLGLEALLRPVGVGGEMIAPGIVFQRAERDGVLLELEREARELALREFAAQRGDAELVLFLNFSAVLLDHGHLDPGRILRTVRGHDLPVESVALEIVESGVQSQEQLASFADRNRASGFLIILDDFGTEHSNLERVALVRPDIIKIDRGIVSGAANDPIKRSVLRSIAYLARQIGALSLAEGIEHYDDLIACAEEGVELGQGFLLGRPAPDLAGACRREQEAASRALRQLRSDLSDRLRSSSSVMQEVETTVASITERLSTAASTEMEAVLEGAVAASPQVQCAYVVDTDGVQRTETVMAPGSVSPRRHPVFQPARRGTNHSLKDYVYGPVALRRNEFLTQPYLSLASGTLCRTYARRFTTGDGDQLILCIDTPHIQ